MYTPMELHTCTLHPSTSKLCCPLGSQTASLHAGLLPCSRDDASYSPHLLTSGVRALAHNVHMLDSSGCSHRSRKSLPSCLEAAPRIHEYLCTYTRASKLARRRPNFAYLGWSLPEKLSLLYAQTRGTSTLILPMGQLYSY
jgi:hypothetical protein